MTEHMTETDIIVDFMKTCTVEVTPGGAAKIESFPEILREGTTVYVTFLPGSDFADTVKTVRRLRDEGMAPVPHFAARSIPSHDFLEENLKMLQGECAVEEALLIGGGVDNPVGEFHCSMQVLETGLFEKYGIKKLGVAGHPEGTPDIKPEDVSKAIQEKNAYAKSTDMELYIATQFCFEAAPIIGDVLSELMETGCALARMSGSGATCFGLYPTADAATQAAQALAEAQPGWWVQPTTLS